MKVVEVVGIYVILVMGWVIGGLCVIGLVFYWYVLVFNGVVGMDMFIGEIFFIEMMLVCIVKFYVD